MSFQMFKLVLEKAEEPETKLPTSAGSWKKQESFRKTSISAAQWQKFRIIPGTFLEVFLSIKKQRYHIADKGPSSQSYGFSSSHAWIWELNYNESWAPKNWCFWTVVLEKTLENPLEISARRSNQSILKEISPECSLEGLILKLKLQYFGHLRWRTDSLEKTLMLG